MTLPSARGVNILEGASILQENSAQKRALFQIIWLFTQKYVGSVYVLFSLFVFRLLLHATVRFMERPHTVLECVKKFAGGATAGMSPSPSGAEAGTGSSSALNTEPASTDA